MVPYVRFNGPVRARKGGSVSGRWALSQRHDGEKHGPADALSNLRHFCLMPAAQAIDLREIPRLISDLSA